MAGIYIHVPFCRQACRYCDFYFTVSLRFLDNYLNALCKEIILRKNYIGSERVETIYFGGGTPSVLTIDQIIRVLNLLKREFSISEAAEITLEANPDDLTKAYLIGLKEAGINRLSIGVQSFHQAELSLMRRSHNSRQSVESILNASEAGFKNINLDLIYGVPGLSAAAWNDNLNQVMQLPVQHLSAYHLTYEPGTIFDHWRKKGRIVEVDEDLSLEHYRLLKEVAINHGFTQYEISNFCKEGFISKHNTGYWTHQLYLGLGPAAHSYNGTERRWNNPSIKEYIAAMEYGGAYYGQELLSDNDKFNDYLIVSLRTARGAGKEEIRSRFGTDVYQTFMSKVSALEASGEMVSDSTHVKIKSDYWFRADGIIRDLMIS